MSHIDPAEDIHPLDRDYSQDASDKKKRWRFLPRDGEDSVREKWLRGGTIVFFIGIFMTAGTAAGSVLLGRRFENIVDPLRQLSLLTILLGGILLVVGFRLQQIREYRVSVPRRFHQFIDPLRTTLQLIFVMLLWIAVFASVWLLSSMLASRQTG